MVVEKASSNGGMSVTFYTCTIGPQIDILKLKRLCYNFCPTSVIRLLDYLLSLHTRIIWVIYHISDMLIAASPLDYCEFSLTTQASVMRAVTNLTENTDLTTSVMGMAFHWTIITTIFNICQSPTLLSFPFSAKRVSAVPWVLSPFV